MNKFYYIAFWVFFFSLASALSDVLTVGDSWAGGGSVDDWYGVKCTILLNSTIRNMTFSPNDVTANCTIVNTVDNSRPYNGTISSGFCGNINFNVTKDMVIRLVSDPNYVNQFGGEYDNTPGFPKSNSYISCTHGTYNNNPWDNSWSDSTVYIWSIASIGITDQSAEGGSPPPVNLDYLTIALGQNVSTNSTIYFNFTTQGNYSYSEVFQGGNLLKNNSDKFYTQTNLANNTEYAYNVSVWWNSTIFNSTGFILSTNQTIQWNLNELQTYLDIEDLKEESNMIWAVLLWIFITAGALSLMVGGNTLVGQLFWYVGYMFDFLLIALIYEKIGLPNGDGISAYFYGLMYIGLAVWLLVKFYIPQLIVRRIKA